MFFSRHSTTSSWKAKAAFSYWLWNRHPRDRSSHQAPSWAQGSHQTWTSTWKISEMIPLPGDSSTCMDPTGKMSRKLPKTEYRILSHSIRNYFSILMAWANTTLLWNGNLKIKYCAQWWDGKAAFTRLSQEFDQPKKVHNDRKKTNKKEKETALSL